MNPVVITIDTLGHRGVGIGRNDGKVVLVPFTAPGDKIEVEIISSHRTYDEGVLLRVREPSSWRCNPPCPVFGRCGGCQYQHLDNGFQLSTKETLFQEMVTHHGDVSSAAVAGIMSTGRHRAYRSRLECRVTWEPGTCLGFKERGGHQVVPFDNCLLALPAIQDAFSGIKELLKTAGSTSVTMVDIAADHPGNEISITLQSSVPLDRKTIDVLRSPLPLVPNLKSLFLRYQRIARAETLWSTCPQSDYTSYGVPCDTTGTEILLTVRPGIFRQVNPDGNKLLISLILQWVQEVGSRRILDLYAGMGNLSIPLSRIVKEVVAVEINAQAVKNGIDNARRLGIRNISWIAQPVTKALRIVSKHAEQFDTVILDPPRSGAKEILAGISAFAPTNILYASCDPATLARDLRILQRKSGYSVIRSVPIDMFPQTFHIESVTLLQKS